MSTNYNAENIKHLDTKEAMRTRINMYLGSSNTNGIYQAFKEIVNNSTDEALAGYGKEIIIEVNEKDNEISVRDFGRGVPFGVVDGRNILVAIYTESHTGGKFDKNAYKNSSGLNGIGGTAVCMSSKDFLVTSIRDNIKAIAKFHEGDLIEYKEVINSEKEQNGTFVKFTPDKDVFIGMEEPFSFEKICEEIKLISYLNKGIRFIIKNIETKEKNEYYSENGLADFIIEYAENPLMRPIICSGKDSQDELEIAFMWTSLSTEKNFVFVNGLRCPELGSPITGIKTTITNFFKKHVGGTTNSELYRRGLICAVNCKVVNPDFENQTKNKINNSNLRSIASQAMKNGLEEFSNTNEFVKIIEVMKRVQKAEKAADKAREIALNHTKEMSDIRKKKLAFIDKLSDAENLGQDAILCIVEGDSAGGSIAMGRDTKKYGILKIRGKMKNGLKAADEEIYQNEEIKLLLYALGIDIDNYNAKKLRYGKIAICVDPDSDGFHIALLIIANLHRLCPQFLEENRLFWLRAPLFIEHDKNAKPISWYYTDEEFNKVRGTLKGDVTRIKGLGALEEADLKATLFSTTGGQVLDEIVYSKEGIEQLCALMGIDVAPRKEFVMQKIDFSRYGDM